jgi:excisionase family DNA binding protein
VAEVADHFSISERSVRRLIADGRLRAVRIGRSIRVVADELEFPDALGAPSGVRPRNPAERRAPDSEPAVEARQHGGDGEDV